MVAFPFRCEWCLMSGWLSVLVSRFHVSFGRSWGFPDFNGVVTFPFVCVI